MQGGKMPDKGNKKTPKRLLWLKKRLVSVKPSPARV